MRVAVLGPLEAYDGDRELDLGGPMNRALVARLALAAGRPVGAGTLIEDLWDGDVPADAANALQSIVSRTRRRLPDGTLLSAPAGYVLHADTDVDAFRRSVAAGDPRQALALWRGDALADLRGFPFGERLAQGLEEARLAALEEDLGTRRPDAAVVAELAELTRAHPYRDGLWLLHLRALAVSGRPNEALTLYQELRTRLADELGADPSPELQQLHTAILRGEVDGGATPGGAAPGASRLPAPLTSFVGRSDAVEELRRALSTHRLVTVLGPGGAGKTRLAVETARACLDRVPDVWIVELATVTDADDVLPAVLTAMGHLEVVVLERPGNRDLGRAKQRALDAAANADGLLVLDNCEHLVDAAARVTEQLLARGPRLRVLATSREALQLIGEYSYQLGPLGLPAEDAGPDEAGASPAVRLFTERAQAVDRSFRLDDVTLPAVREICRRLDGQPLAIELAAARLRTLAVGEVASRLSDRFRLLTGGSRTLPRHRTLRAVVEWSWDLLTEAERDLAERVAVFPAGVTAEGAAAVTGGDDEVELLDLLESLADKSLLVPVRRAGRFRMLETLREYGVERLVERGVAEKVRSAHLDHLVDVAEGLATHMSDARQIDAIARLDVERGNLTAALRFAIDRGDRARAGRLVRALAFFWAIRNEHAEMHAAAAATLQLPGRADPATEIAVEAMALIGSFVGRREETEWQAPVDRILALWDEHRPDDPLTVVILTALDHFGVTGGRTPPPIEDLWTRSMINLLRLAMLENDGRTLGTAELVEETVDGFRQCGDAWGLAASLSLLGTLRSYDGDFPGAAEALAEAYPLLERLGAEEDAGFSRTRLSSLRIVTADAAQLAALRAELTAELSTPAVLGNRTRLAFTRLSLSQILHLQGDDAASAAMLQDLVSSVGTVDVFGGDQFLGMVRSLLAVSTALAGDAATARAQLRQAAQSAFLSRDMPVVAFVLVAGAVLAEKLDDDPERAARLLGTADAVRGRPDRTNLDAEALAQRLRARLGEERFANLAATGSTVPRENVLDDLRA